LNVNQDEGVALAKEYAVGTTYPVFVLIDSAGTEINRWIGYTGGSPALIRTLKWALQDLTPITDRESRFKTSPTKNEALFLAGYFSKSGKYDKSVAYYRRALDLGRAMIMPMRFFPIPPTPSGMKCFRSTAFIPPPTPC